MLSRVNTATIVGLTPHHITVEIDAVFGKPSLHIIGLPNRAIEESKERVTAALSNCGVRIKPLKTIVNLAPADLRKTGSAFELAIAVAFLKLYEIDKTDTSDALFFGELSLDGSIRPIRGLLPLVLAAKQMGFEKVFVPEKNCAELSSIKNINVFPLRSLGEYLDFCKEKKPISQMKNITLANKSKQKAPLTHQIIGQKQAKRALQIAAAGGHNLLMIGPPGSGKSTLAKSMMSLLPSLSREEQLEASIVHSLRGLTKDGLLQNRPFRNPHHTISKVGLLGGGNQLLPGEISLAHHGVLFLDEISEFPRHLLETIRQPLEEGHITLSRSVGTVRYPAKFSLIAATNPCPCGYLYSKTPCKCSRASIERYQKKLSGPLLDRIDLHVWVEPVEASLLKLEKESYPTRISTRVIKARRSHTQMPIEPTARKLLNTAANNLQLSTRGFYSVVRVAKTIALMENQKTVTTKHIAEALQYRPK